MELYFNNDGTYGKQAVGKPVRYKDDNIGYIKSVDESRVILEIWDAHPCITAMYALQENQDICSMEFSR